MYWSATDSRSSQGPRNYYDAGLQRRKQRPHCTVVGKQITVD